ncbi:MAG: RNA polymerase sigma factor, partial [Woeseiaceae bacterium]
AVPGKALTWTANNNRGAIRMGALEELYLSMRGGISRMVSRIVPPDDVDDIVQETYIRLSRVVLSQEIQHPRSYLYQTARNLALDSIKKAANSRSVEWHDDAAYAATINDSVINEIDSDEKFHHFCESVDRLPSRAQQVFVLKKVYGYTQREIAMKLGISESTVEKHVALALRRSTEYMSPFSPAP